MRNLIFTLISIVHVFPHCLAQTEKEKILSNLSGLSQNTVMYFEVEGYQVAISNEPEKYDEHGIFIVRNRFQIDREIKAKTDTVLLFENKVFENKTKLTETIPMWSITYLLRNKEQEITAISFTVAKRRDVFLERTIIEAYKKEEYLQDHIDSTIVDSLNFVGRKIKIFNGCQWMGPANFNCSYNGQVSWSLYRSIESALEATALSIEITQSKKAFKTISEEQVDILFEGVPTKATKIIYKSRAPKLLTGISSPLHVYYITQQIRGKFVSCVISYYENEMVHQKPPYLASQIMSIK